MSASTRTHIIKIVNSPGSKPKYTCELCQEEWAGPPRISCPGVKVFSTRDPQDCPPHFKTLAELKVKGLRPKDENHPSAAFRPSKKVAWEHLYDETKAIPIKASNTLLRLLRIWSTIGTSFLSIFIAGFVSILFGFNTPPSSLSTVPLIAFVLHYPTLSLIIFCGLILITLIGSLLFLRLTSEEGIGVLKTHIHPWSIVTATSTISFLLCFVMLTIVFFRPPWCPTSLCLPAPIANLPGVHDANLNLYFLTFQSDSIVIPGDPTHASVNSISNERSSDTVNAVLLKNHLSSSIYRVVLVARSLYQGRYSIVIDQVALTIVDQSVLPQPLNVWLNKSFAQYNASRYGIVYRGEGAGIVLPAKYLEAPDGYTQLATNESDQLDIQIDSHIPAALKFRMQMTYHIATDQRKYTLQLPQTFEVIFSDQSNWHSYQLQSGRFAATT